METVFYKDYASYLKSVGQAYDYIFLKGKWFYRGGSQQEFCELTHEKIKEVENC